jgi:hypothetical protein
MLVCSPPYWYYHCPIPHTWATLHFIVLSPFASSFTNILHCLHSPWKSANTLVSASATVSIVFWSHRSGAQWLHETATKLTRQAIKNPRIDNYYILFCLISLACRGYQCCISTLIQYGGQSLLRHVDVHLYNSGFSRANSLSLATLAMAFSPWLVHATSIAQPISRPSPRILKQTQREINNSACSLPRNKYRTPNENTWILWRLLVLKVLPSHDCSRRMDSLFFFFFGDLAHSTRSWLNCENALYIEYRALIRHYPREMNPGLFLLIRIKHAGPRL